MRVGVDATSWSNRRGYGRFARNALGRLVDLDAETAYVFYVGEDADELPERVERRALPLQAPAAHERRGLGDALRLRRAARSDRLDVLVFPSVYSWFPPPRVPTLVGVHDTTPADFPELTLPGRRDRLAWRVKERLALRGASRVFTVSEAARQALVLRGVAAGRVSVVPEAPAPEFRPAPGAGEELARLGVPEGPYLLYAAGISPHKDVETLLEAYALLEDAPPLLLVGDPDDGYLSARDSVLDRIRLLGLGGRVFLTGFVPDEGLARLYSGALAVVCPSLAEGFGLPPVEAAACGAATVLSDIPAHRETLGEAALFFPPRDVEALRAQLVRVLADEEERRRLGAAGRVAVARLSWDASAAALQELVHEVARG